MRRSSGCITLLLALAPLLGASAVHAQVIDGTGGERGASDVPVEEAAGADSTGLVLADRQWLSNLRLAKRLVDQGNFADAVLLLQDLLDRASHQDGVPSEVVDLAVLRSLPAEIESVLAALPAEGRAAYNAKFAAEADRLLEVALAASDFELVQAVARRYFFSPAGRKAALLVADQMLDQRRPFAAALSFDRVRESEDLAAEDRATSTVKSAVAWLRCGQADVALARLEELKSASASGDIVLPGVDVAPFTDPTQALNWVRENLASDARLAETRDGDWTLAGGDATRSGGGSGPRPGTAATWSDFTCRWQGEEDARLFFSGGRIDLSRQIEAIQAEALKRDRTPLPACTPLVVGEMVIARALNGLRAYDRATGKLKWETAAAGRLVEDIITGKSPPPPGAKGSMLDPLLRQRMFTDGTFGGLSSDGRLVYSVEDLGVSPEQEEFVQQRLRIIQARAAKSASPGLAGKNTNCLAAHDVSSGKIVWQTGDVPPLAGHFFLGAPLPLAGGLYVLAEHEQTVRLLVLDPATGESEWSLDLDKAPLAVANDHLRGQAGLSPSFRDGLFICPTGVGKIVAVDPASRRIAWRYQYRRYDETDPNNQQVMIRMMAANGRIEQEQKPPGEWLDSHAIVAGDRVLLTPRDSDELHCLDLVSGKVRWKLPRGERLHVGGVCEGLVILVGRQGLELVGLADGKPVRTAIELGAPAGRGVLLADSYFVPLSSGEIVQVELKSGRVVARHKLADGIVPGNLVSAGQAVVSQSFDRVAALKPNGE